MVKIRNIKGKNYKNVIEGLCTRLIFVKDPEGIVEEPRKLRL
jgi:hypothetical protein